MKKFCRLGVSAALVIGAGILFGCGGTTGGAATAAKNPSDPVSIPKYVEQLVIPPVMPPAGLNGGETYYEIAAKQFQQQVLPTGWPKTTVWGYGKADDPATFNYPAFTVEVEKDVPVRVKWINGLVDAQGNYLKYFLPVDQSINWANPLGAAKTADPYTGPAPIVTHVHGSHVDAHSDGGPMAWFLPDALDLPAGASAQGPGFTQLTGEPVVSGSALYRYINTQPAQPYGITTTRWGLRG